MEPIQDPNTESNPHSDGVSSREFAAGRMDLAAANHRYGPIQQVQLGSTNGEVPTFNFVRHMRGVLRGRYALIIALGIVTGTLGAFGGWRFGHPIYSSSGLLRIAYQLPEVLTETDQNGPMQMFDTYMQSQKLLITSRSVLDKAVEDPIWHATGHEVPDDPEGYFREHLTVTINSRSEYIQITVEDRDGGMAAAAVTAIVDAYQALYLRQTSEQEDARMGALKEEEAPLDSSIQGLNGEIEKISAEYGTADLSSFYAAAVDRVNKTEGALEDIRNAIALAPAESASSATTADPATPPTSMASVEQIAAVDPQMQQLLDHEYVLEDKLKELQTKFGPKNVSILNAQADIEEAQAAINRYANLHRQFSASTGGQNLGDPTHTQVITAGRSRESLQESERSLSALYKTEYQEMVSLGNTQIGLEHKRQELAEAQDDRDKIARRIDALQAEDLLGGRLSITSSPEIPLGPEKDPRLKFAAAAGVAGAAFPAALLVACSLLVKGKLRYSTDAEGDLAARIPLLGIVPTVKINGEGGEEDLSAAHCIHQIRVSLKAQAPHDRRSSVYLVTSAAAGEGKTNLTMALGLSFAATRVRTLLIDCDLIGRQLSNTLDARDFPGLHEAIGAGTIRRRLRKAAKNLYLLPAGQVGTNDYFSVSAAKLRPLLTEARRHFDIILIDTGPILGSVEAAVLAKEVDGVLFTVARNQRRAIVERAIHRLNSLDARLEGLIFNRARSEDFESSLYSTSSTRSVRSSPQTNGHSRGPAMQQVGAFGPLVQAVAFSLPSREPAEFASKPIAS